MRDAAREIVDLSHASSREDLDSNKLLALSLTKLVEILGEAASTMSLATRERYPSLPWQDIADMRHHRVHRYFDVNLDILWDTVPNDVPSLLPQLEAMAAEANP